MSGVRLYVGDLGGSVDEGALKAHLAKYGNVVQVSMKEKKDAEGIVMTRFAYVNIEAPNNQIQQCINSLNGHVWKGSRLKVERARESFMERLQRERAANNQNQLQNKQPQAIIPRQVSVKATQIEQSQISFKPQGSSQINQKGQGNKRPLINTEQKDTDGTVKKKKVYESSSDSSESDSSDDSSDEVRNGIPMFRGAASLLLDNENERKENKFSSLNEKKYHNEKDNFKFKNKEKFIRQGDSGLFKDSMVKSKDKVEEDLLSNFKSFSSVWGDTDDEGDDDEGDSGDEDENYDDDAISETGKEESKVEQKEKGQYKDSGSISEEPGFFIDLHPAKVSSLQSGVVHNKSRSATANVDIEDDALGDVETERQAQLDILSNILGKPISVTEHKTDDKKGQHMKRYDPTLPEHKQYEVSREQQKPQQSNSQESAKTNLSKKEILTDSVDHKPLGQDKYIKVSQNLNFKEKSEGFSLLSMFSQKKTESSGESEEEDEEDMEESTESITSSQFPVESGPISKVKTKFFLRENDAVIGEGIQWLSQSLTQEVCDEFDKIRPDLVQVYKTRMVRAKRDAKSSRGRGRGRGRVREPLKDRQQSKPNQNKNDVKENNGVVKGVQFNSKRKFEGRGRGRGRGLGRGRGRGRGLIQGKG
ncbi:unnamed protein product, partial [Meganyctiphanes norvegica]